MKIILIFPMLLAAAVISFGQTREKANPIDVTEEKCLKTHHGTMPRAECYSKAFEAWEADVAKTYAAIDRQFSGEEKSAFEKAQTDWEKYRDSEFEFISAKYAGKRGTGYIAARIISRLEIVKSKALLLE